jgi:putative heme-binding domain-containing protein
MNDGTTHTGIAMRRGGNSEAYLGIDGKEFRIDKRKIKAKQELYTSLMPPGLAYTMSLEELRNLIAFLLQQR